MGHTELEFRLKVLIYCEEVNNNRTNFDNLTALVRRFRAFCNTTPSSWVRGFRRFEKNRDHLTLEEEGTTFLRNTGAIHSMTQRHILEDLKAQ